jgi:hypothetical protein
MPCGGDPVQDEAIRELIDSVFAAHGVRLDAKQAAAMLEERHRYAALLREYSAEPLSALDPEREPARFRDVLEGWPPGGAARRT